jgi:hypothetical protein
MNRLLGIACVVNVYVSTVKHAWVLTITVRAWAQYSTADTRVLLM